MLRYLQVTLKIQWKEQAVRQNLDLYNSPALDKLVRKCAETFSLGTAYMADVFEALINTLEKYRLHELKKGLKTEVREPMKPERKRRWKPFLKSLNYYKEPMT